MRAPPLAPLAEAAILYVLLPLAATAGGVLVHAAAAPPRPAWMGALALASLLALCVLVPLALLLPRRVTPAPRAAAPRPSSRG